MKAKIFFLAVAVLCLLALPATVLATGAVDDTVNPGVQVALDAAGQNAAVPVLVYTSGALDRVQDALPAVVETTELPLVDAVAAYLTADEIALLAEQDFVIEIVPDNPVYGFDYQSSMDITNLTIGLGDATPPAAGGPDGSGVSVAILDSGVGTNTDLASSRIVGWKDFVKGKMKPYDDAGHGTFVAGLVAGDGSASLPIENGGKATMQYRGVAPDANLVGIKVLDEFGQGRTSAVIAGIAWAIAHKDEYGIRVLNISLGTNPTGPVSEDPIAQAVEAAWKAGIVVVCAAGNEGEFGPGSVLSPGNDPYVITVGGTETQQTALVNDDAMLPYSSVGPTLFDEIAKPDIVAPGRRLISLREKSSYIDRSFPESLIPVATYIPDASNSVKPNYLMLSGTSTSAPVVSGAVALMLEADPSLKPDDVKLRLMSTADPLAGIDSQHQGAGLIDVHEALGSTARSNGYALSTDLGNGTTVLSEDTYVAWDKFAWTKFAWTKFAWTKFAWTALIDTK